MSTTDSPTTAFAVAAMPIPAPELDLIPHALPTSHSGDEADTSMSADEARPSARDPVAYADPRQHGELNKLKYLLKREGTAGAHAEGDAGAERELDLQLGLEKEMTLAQLPDVLETEAVVASASKGKRPVPRARKGRGRKAAR